MYQINTEFLKYVITELQYIAKSNIIAYKKFNDDVERNGILLYKFVLNDGNFN